jgi:predicted amidophosphoribosyltransferase
MNSPTTTICLLCDAPATTLDGFCDTCYDAINAPEPTCRECGKQLEPWDREISETTCIERNNLFPVISVYCARHIKY